MRSVLLLIRMAACIVGCLLHDELIPGTAEDLIDWR